MGLENKNIYWKIEYEQTNWMERHCSFKMLGWDSQQDRIDNPRKPMVQTEMNILGDNFDLDPSKPKLTQLYKKVKTMDKWVFSQDVLEATETEDAES